MNTEIANAVNAAGDKAQYDTRVKRLLAQKSILAHILVKTEQSMNLKECNLSGISLCHADVCRS